MSLRVSSSLSSLLLTLLVSASSSTALAWGERGHDLVARVAARLVAQRGGAAVAKPFVEKEHMLGHLANVPDIVWRSAGKEIEAQNGPTHYIDVEYFDLTPTFAEMPANAAVLLQHMKDLCAKPIKDYVCPADKPDQVQVSQAGTAPFRVRQFFNLMKDGFARAKAAPAGKDGDAERDAGIDAALLAGGILAHFVGDLGNPLHTTRDYNGYERGQGGLHSYFESEAVNALDLTFDSEMHKAAQQGPSLARLTKMVPAAEQKTFGSDPLKVANALILDSFSRLGNVFELDRKQAVTKLGSSEHGMKLKAERRPATATAKFFRPLLVERTATAADALAHLWLEAWEQAGKPDLSGYGSWNYPTTPQFIPPDYLPATE